MRIKIDLQNLWDFVIDPNDLGESQNWQNKSNFTFLEDVIKIAVPSCWNFAENSKLYGYTGAAWYFTEFRIPKFVEGTQIFLKFEGINNKAKIFIDGIMTYEHEGGYIPFEIDISKLEKEKDLFLVVKVDNRLDVESIPNKSYHKNYGGIIRDVYISIRQKIFLEDYNLSTRLIWDEKNKAKHAELDFNIYIKNETDKDFKGTLHKKLIRNHVVIAEDKHEVDCLKRNTRLSIKKLMVNNPLLWTPQNPEAYNIECSLIDESGFETDRIEGVWAFREIEIVNKHILLNKASFISIGINRQADHPEFGSALPSNLTINDLSTVKRLGFNSIKFSGFIPEEFTCELTDRLGLISTISIPLELNESLLKNKMALQRVVKKAKNYLKTVVTLYKNYVSIFAWNICSLKSDWSPEIVKVINELCVFIRETLKSKKLITITTEYLNNIPNDLGVDFISADIGLIENKEDFNSKCSELLVKAGLSQKPIMLTDFTIYGKQIACADESDMDSLIKQSQIIEEAIDRLRSPNILMGYCLGILNDFYNEGSAQEINFSGLLDAYRNAKPVITMIEQHLVNKK